MFGLGLKSWWCMSVMGMYVTFEATNFVGAVKHDESGGLNVEKICTLGSCTYKHPHEHSPVYEMCSHTTNTTIFGRCCLYNDTGFIKGVDLALCNITDLSILTTIRNTTTIETLLLQNNSIECSNNTEMYRGFKSLNLLTLPEDCTCPNEEYWNNITHHQHMTQCTGEMNICTAHNNTCPAHSFCVEDGPGLFECLCNSDSHGYKCMRQGYISTIPFSIGAVGATVVAGAVSLGVKRWFTLKSK